MVAGGRCLTSSSRGGAFFIRLKKGGGLSKIAKPNKKIRSTYRIGLWGGFSDPHS